MKNTILKAGFALSLGVFVASCSDDSNSSGSSKKDVVKNYADIVYQNYKDAYDDAVELESAINAFTAAPSQITFDAAKAKWKESRESYGTTEAFRFANGPIDDEDGPEGLINAWPLDEAYIDYVDGNANAGIINNTVDFPIIDKATLESLNEDGAETNISVGYHAIEFLLWGQDLTAPSANQAGLRSFTDYVAGSSATNQARRAAYLKVCADLLTDHLDYLVGEWEPGGAYRTTFLALPTNQALKNIYLGITTLVSAELSGERMRVALDNADQEDEHSCFSDNTDRDIFTNLKGIINVYQGKYGTIDGPSLEDLVQKADNATYTDTNESISLALSKVNAIGRPFDYAISSGNTAGREKVAAAIDQLNDLGANLLAGATKIGIQVNN